MKSIELVSLGHMLMVKPWCRLCPSSKGDLKRSGGKCDQKKLKARCHHFVIPAGGTIGGDLEVNQLLEREANVN
jgi:hypothetical protein